MTYARERFLSACEQWRAPGALDARTLARYAMCDAGYHANRRSAAARTAALARHSKIDRTHSRSRTHGRTD